MLRLFVSPFFAELENFDHKHYQRKELEVSAANTTQETSVGSIEIKSDGKTNNNKQ